jgi:hypothetical protein
VTRAHRLSLWVAIAIVGGVTTSIAVAGWCAVACGISAADFELGRLTRDGAPCDFVRIYRRAGVQWTEWWSVDDLSSFFGKASEFLLDGTRLKETVHDRFLRAGAWPLPDRLGRTGCKAEGGCVGVRDGRGWPLAALQRLEVVHVPYVMTYNEAVSLHPPHQAEVEVLAGFKPAWGGLLVDTLLYGTLWFALCWLVWKGWQTPLGSLLLWTVVSGVAGVAITVGVAWGVALWSDPLIADPSMSRTLHRHELWEVEILEQRGTGALRVTSQWYDRDVGFGAQARRGVEVESRGWLKPDIPEWAFSMFPQGSPSNGMCHDRTMDARGWPLPALVGRVTMDYVAGGVLSKPVLIDALHLPISSTTPQTSGEVARLLPFAPIWSGFVLNTTLFASVLWTLGVAAFLFRRQLRVMRGLCPRCAYVVPDRSAGCPECGWHRATSHAPRGDVPI